MKYKLSNKEKIYPIEPPCKKTMYESKDSAMEAITYVMATRRVTLDAYKCTVCGFWHLTSAGRKN